jgi:hypothetical protein
VGRLGDEGPADEIFEIPRHRPPSISRANLGRCAVPTLFDGFVLHKFAGATGPLFAHEKLVIGGESGHLLEPLVRRAVSGPPRKRRGWDSAHDPG